MWHGSPVRFSAGDVAAATGGRLVGATVEDGPTVDGAAIDSRQVEPGQLFVAVVAERDGHAFVADAARRGAAAALVSRPVEGLAAVVVGDTSVALGRLGAAARARMPGPVVGVTGSVGKTTVKDLVAAALSTSRRTAASVGSHNNELGVPLTLVGAPDDVEVVVVEMGARAVGDIAALAALATPTVGVVTAVSAAHTETFGGLEQVAQAKGELVEALAADGTAVLNAEDPRVAAMATRTAARVLTYGVHHGDVRVASLVLDDRLRPRFELETPWGVVEVALELRGAHMALNAAGAAAAALSLGVDLAGVGAGLGAAVPAPGRMRVRELAGGAVVLDDSYNANPRSMAAALDALAAMPGRRRVAVLGQMAELGEGHDAGHREVADHARARGIDLVVVGETAYGEPTVPGPVEALGALGALGPGDVVLVKASRAVGLERVVELLTDPLS